MNISDYVSEKLTKTQKYLPGTIYRSGYWGSYSLITGVRRGTVSYVKLTPIQPSNSRKWDENFMKFEFLKGGSHQTSFDHRDLTFVGLPSDLFSILTDNLNTNDLCKLESLLISSHVLRGRL